MPPCGQNRERELVERLELVGRTASTICAQDGVLRAQVRSLVEQLDHATAPWWRRRLREDAAPGCRPSNAWTRQRRTCAAAASAW
jgi:hypothetical protein